MSLRQLVLMRHGIAEDTPPLVIYKGVQRQGGDADRRLTDEGKKRVRFVVESLAKICDPRPLVIASPLVRAQQTAGIFTECFPGLNWAPETLDSLTPESYPIESLSDLSRLVTDHQVKTAVVVGHQPHISAFCSLLVTGNLSPSIVQFGRATAAVLEPISPLRPQSCMIRYVIRPKILNPDRI